MGSWSLAVVAAVVIGYAGVSRRLERSVISAAMVFVTAGLIAGPEVLGWLDLKITSEGVRVIAEATLTLVLFADASRIDLRLLRREAGLPVRLLGVGLPLAIAAGTVLAAAVLTRLTWPEALVLAIVLAPTDAALGQAVVTDKRLPSRIRQGLNVESGLNDGICVPLLFIALAVAEAEEQVIGGGAAARIVAEEIGYGVVGGIAAGAVAELVLRFVEPRRLVADDFGVRSEGIYQVKAPGPPIPWRSATAALSWSGEPPKSLSVLVARRDNSSATASRCSGRTPACSSSSIARRRRCTCTDLPPYSRISVTPSTR